MNLTREILLKLINTHTRGTQWHFYRFTVTGANIYIYTNEQLTTADLSVVFIYIFELGMNLRFEFRAFVNNFTFSENSYGIFIYFIISFYKYFYLTSVFDDRQSY